MQHGLEAEQSARARSERLLEDMRQGHRQMQALIGELKVITQRLTSALAEERRMPQTDPGRIWPAETVTEAVSLAPGAEMAEALAAAVERLRARADAVADPQPAPPLPAPARVPHKHSMSFLGRRRIRRKQRRSA